MLKRIIPAYAGSTRALNPGGVFSADHPRIRGEHTSLWADRDFVSGSSPHTRGAPQMFEDPDLPPGIIPAYAGSTSKSRVRIQPVKDHPRIRGEHVLLQGDRGAGRGSSPHTRGAPATAPAKTALTRIIPAYAGSTFNALVLSSRATDHPRIRGEHADGVLTRMSIGGSSPHTRGARCASSPISTRQRIIPAYAGSTPGRHSPAPTPRDHPRIRGEHALRVGGHLQVVGSSPHTRGAREENPSVI